MLRRHQTGNSTHVIGKSSDDEFAYHFNYIISGLSGAYEHDEKTVGDKCIQFDVILRLVHNKQAKTLFELGFKTFLVAWLARVKYYYGRVSFFAWEFDLSLYGWTK